MKLKYAECMHIVHRNWNAEQKKSQKDNMQDFLVLWYHVKWNFFGFCPGPHQKPQYICLLMLKAEFYAIKYQAENHTLKDF